MVLLEGPLSKWTNVMKGWQFRWFLLEENSGLLSYYTSKEKMMKGVRRGCVRLKGAVIGIDDQDVNTFTITVDHKTFHFQAKDAEEREKWVRRLEDTILRHANRNRGIWSSDQSYNSPYSGESKRSNYLHALDKRISEADAYLQLMIEQIKKIEQKIAAAETVPPSSPASDADGTEQNAVDQKADSSMNPNKALLDSANAMLESFKHSIVLLQIAKNTAHPVTGIYQGPGAHASALPKTVSDLADHTSDCVDIVRNIGPSSLPAGIEFGSDCLEKKLLQSKRSSTDDASPSSMQLHVPETSYSSSEGEDDFYDATENPFSSSASLKEEDELTDKSSIAVTAKSTTSSQRDSITTAFRNDGSLDYDALYEDDTENDISMESHGSVVTHLLSQVKIGMDLTKVVLPTFILERRSLLEMYADYFAHPDLFLNIADTPTPRERMIETVRWYLSSYHAGRKSAVAKKPYNPILGEIFQCHWDLPDSINKDAALANDGPVPWCKQNQLTFVAEQVSHHPPSMYQQFFFVLCTIELTQIMCFL